MAGPRGKKSSQEELEERLAKLKGPAPTDQEIEARYEKLTGEKVSLAPPTGSEEDQLLAQIADEVRLEQKSKRLEAEKDKQLSDRAEALITGGYQHKSSDNLLATKKHCEEHIHRLKSALKVYSTPKAINDCKNEIKKFESRLTAVTDELKSRKSVESRRQVQQQPVSRAQPESSESMWARAKHLDEKNPQLPKGQKFVDRLQKIVQLNKTHPYLAKQRYRIFKVEVAQKEKHLDARETQSNTRRFRP